MKPHWYTFYFKSGSIVVSAFTENNAQILAQAEAIKRGWDPAIVPTPKLKKLDMVINWSNLTNVEQIQLHALLTKANYLNE